MLCKSYHYVIIMIIEAIIGINIAIVVDETLILKALYLEYLLVTLFHFIEDVMKIMIKKIYKIKVILVIVVVIVFL